MKTLFHMGSSVLLSARAEPGDAEGWNIAAEFYDSCYEIHRGMTVSMEDCTRPRSPTHEVSNTEL